LKKISIIYSQFAGEQAILNQHKDIILREV